MIMIIAILEEPVVVSVLIPTNQTNNGYNNSDKHHNNRHQQYNLLRGGNKNPIKHNLNHVLYWILMGVLNRTTIIYRPLFNPILCLLGYGHLVSRNYNNNWISCSNNWNHNNIYNNHKHYRVQCHTIYCHWIKNRIHKWLNLRRNCSVISLKHIQS